jgi:hypothetical protein
MPFIQLTAHRRIGCYVRSNSRKEIPIRPGWRWTRRPPARCDVFAVDMPVTVRPQTVNRPPGRI